MRSRRAHRGAMVCAVDHASSVGRRLGPVARGGAADAAQGHGGRVDERLDDIPEVPRFWTCRPAAGRPDSRTVSRARPGLPTAGASTSHNRLTDSAVALPSGPRSPPVRPLADMARLCFGLARVRHVEEVGAAHAILVSHRALQLATFGDRRREDMVPDASPPQDVHPRDPNPGLSARTHRRKSGFDGAPVTSNAL